MKKCLYLIITEGKVNKKLSLLNNKYRDTLILTWKKPIQKGIFFPFSTWTTGRNRLYQEIINRKLDKKYLYFIFMDGDFILKSKSQEEPFKIFERYLEKYLPAIGFPYFLHHKKSSDEISAYYEFDGGFFAIHKEALHTQFPYYDNEDKLNWCYSQAYFFYLTSILYQGFVLQFNLLESINKNSSYYEKINWGYVNNNFIKSIKNKDFLKFFKQESPPNLSSLKENTKELYNYHFDNNFLSKIFNYKHPLWKRRLKIKRDIKNKKFISKCKLSYMGELSKKTLGIKITNLLFIIFINLQIFWSNLKLKIFINYFNNAIGRIGIILKKYSPQLYYFLKKPLDRLEKLNNNLFILRFI